MQFPEEPLAVEGEAVLFQAKVTGIPQPKLMQYHNGEEVMADYSRELAEDGTLTTDVRHSGTYELVAQNPEPSREEGGRREREVRLFVEAEDMQQRPATTKPSRRHRAVPVAMFSSHVEQNHMKNNQGFRDEFEVCC